MQPLWKKLLAEAIIISAVLILAACGPENGSTPSSQAQPTSAVSEPETGNATSAPTPVDINCAGPDPLPIGESIAQTYDVTYEQVMTWFCSGYTFDDILIALETSQATDANAADLLAMSKDMSWEDIWVKVGFTPK